MLAKQQRPLALITGASAGIGEAIAREYAANNYDVILVARRKEKLEQLGEELSAAHSISTYIHCVDLSRPDSTQQIVQYLQTIQRDIEILVNNAGFGLAPEFTNTSWQEQASFLQLMLNTPCELAHALLPAMRKRGHGSIINIASMAGFAPAGRGHTLYAASKAALIKFSQSLYMENQKYGLHIVAVCPGLTYSEFHDVNGQRGKLEALPKYLWQSSEDVAKATFKAGQRSNPVCIPGPINKTLYILNKILPEQLTMHLMKARHR